MIAPPRSRSASTPEASSARRRAVLATLAGAVLAAVAVFAVAPSPAAGGPATLITPACTTSGLVVWLDTQGNGAAGSVYYRLELTNLSGHPCTLQGYPRVSAVDLAGHRLGSAASRETAQAPLPVTLPNGSTAVAVLRIVEAGNFPRPRCRPVTAAGLRVFPPGQTRAKLIPFPFPACSRSGPVYLSVRAVRKA